MNLRFIVSRIRNAPLTEMFYRIRQEALLVQRKKILKYGNSPLNVPVVYREAIAALRMPALHMYVTDEVIEGLLAGDVWTLNADVKAITYLEEKTGRTFFSSIRGNDDDPDIRAVWEPARLQHVATLLTYARLNPESALSGKCSGAARKLLFDWLAKNPFLYGPHYISVMECGLRIPVFIYALKSLSLDEQESARIISAMFHHAWWIEKRLSLYSSLGNHTVCECVGLVFAGALFRNSQEGQRWLKKGLGLLGQELDHQLLPDGGPAEQSLNYHRFVLDLYWLAVDFLEKNSLADCAVLKPRLIQGEVFIAAFTDDHGVIPAIGDSDDGHAIAPGIAPLRGKAEAEIKRCRRFPYSGYAVLWLDNGVMVTFDHGPLGMAPLYNHGHADALSITVTKDGEQIIVDPGTYRYNGVAEWRKYFKGTRAHNTVTIDGLDQAVQETGFIWSKPFTSELVRSEENERGILIEALNDGYGRLKQPVKHRRAILVADEACLLIKDSFLGRGIHDYELNFHLHPDAAVEEHDGWWHLRKGESRISMTLLGDDNFTSVHGQEAPILGWYSPAYGIRQKSTVLQTRRNGHPEDVSFVTVICLDGQLPKGELERMAKTL
jgi:hypothetical protein